MSLGATNPSNLLENPPPRLLMCLIMISGRVSSWPANQRNERNSSAKVQDATTSSDALVQQIKLENMPLV